MIALCVWSFGENQEMHIAGIPSSMMSALASSRLRGTMFSLVRGIAMKVLSRHFYMSQLSRMSSCLVMVSPPCEQIIACRILDYCLIETNLCCDPDRSISQENMADDFDHVCTELVSLFLTASRDSELYACAL